MKGCQGLLGDGSQGTANEAEAFDSIAGFMNITESVEARKVSGETRRARVRRG
jgi:hypothetical protein